jgi:hypothetical protein
LAAQAGHKANKRKANAGKRPPIASESWISKAASVGIRDREIQTEIQTSKVQTVNYSRSARIDAMVARVTKRFAISQLKAPHAGLLLRHCLLRVREDSRAQGY